MAVKTYTVEMAVKMVKKTLKASDWTNRKGAEEFGMTEQALGRFLNHPPKVLPKKIEQALGLKRIITPIKYINEGE